MAIYRKTESGQLVRTAGHMVQRWNDKVFTTEHVIIDGADYYILDPDANKYLTGSTNYTILHIYVSEPNVSTDAYITFANKTLKLCQSTGGAVLVGQVSGHISLYTLDTIDNNIYIGNVLIENTVSVNINNGTEEAGKYISAIAVDVMDVHKLNITKANLPVIPDIELNDNTETSGKYISKIDVDATNKHKLTITKSNLPQGFSGDYNDLTNIPKDVILELASLNAYTELEKEIHAGAIKLVMTNDALDPKKYDDFILFYNNVYYHYESFYEHDGEYVTLVFNVNNEFRVTLDINVAGDDGAGSLTKTALLTQSYVDNAISAAIVTALGGDY